MEGGGVNASPILDIIAIIAGLIVCVSVFLTWITIHVDSVITVSNDLTGLELFDNQYNFDLRYCPIISLVFGAIAIVFSIVKMVLRSNLVGYVSIAAFVVSAVSSGIFIIDAPFEEIIFGMIYHSVTVCVAPFIVLFASAIGIVVSILPIVAGDTCCLGSLGSAGSVKKMISSAGFTVDQNGDFRRDSICFGHLYGTFVRIYDQDLTYDMVPYKAISSVSFTDGKMSLVYDSTMMSRITVCANSDNVFIGRGRGSKE